MKSKVNDCLKYWRVIRYFIKQKYGLTTADLDMLLFYTAKIFFPKKNLESLIIYYLGMKTGSTDYSEMDGLKCFAAGEKNLKLFTV